ncbi:4Fe-4S binding protein [Klebsiella variicola subsp. variicola]|nr:4Fe-4S binding protein [Klebsiella variicola subsp. variicola]
MAQSGDSVQVSQEKCIGCKSCMVACPFRGDAGGGDAAGCGPGKGQRAEMRSVPGPRGGTGLCGKLSRAGTDPSPTMRR